MSDNQLNECIQEAQNAESLDDKERLVMGIRQQYGKIKSELSDLLHSSWTQNIEQIKQSMVSLEQENRSHPQSTTYRQKMEALQRQLDQQQKERTKKTDSVHKSMMMQETRIKSLESELQRLRKEKEHAEL